jgi:hypothetical protein
MGGPSGPPIMVSMELRTLRVRPAGVRRLALTILGWLPDVDAACEDIGVAKVVDFKLGEPLFVVGRDALDALSVE